MEQQFELGFNVKGLNMNALRLFLFLAIAMPVVSYADEESGESSEIVEICIQAQEPVVCLKSYGFVCHQSRRYDMSLEAYGLGCNLALADGRYHFVQVLYDDGGWAVENQHTYLPEQDEIRTEAEDTGLALSNYVHEEMKNHSILLSRSGTVVGSGHLNGPSEIEIGTRRQGEQIGLRAVCGAALGDQPNEMASMGIEALCEDTLLRSIVMYSQPQAPGPYRAAGAAEIDWSSKTATLASSDTALIIEGNYTFPQKHRPCRFINDCCATESHIYLDSCRVPTESELEAVKICLARDLQSLTEEYFACMREADVKIGCDEQADGSRICY